MEKVTVEWFNKTKGFGEGLTQSGSKVYLHYSAMDLNPNEKFYLEPGDETICELKEDKEYGLFAYKIDHKIQKELTL